MDPTLIQILNHLYDVQQEINLLRAFIAKNEGVLRAANADMPPMSESQTGEAPEA